MGNGQMAERRRARSRNETVELFKPLEVVIKDIRGIVQCGLGDWAEGPVLLKTFPHCKFMAVEPVHRFGHEAWRDGFRGPIIQGALWNKTGETLTFNDFRSRTSIHDHEDRFLGKLQARTLTLDDALRFAAFDAFPLMLWMDCEGAELTILEGAAETLRKTLVIVCELKDEPKFPGWPPTPEVIDRLRGLGFTMTHRIADNGLFMGV